MMRDGKALQLATSHELGQNFARAFDITYADEGGSLQLCWTTSWGSSTRMVGGVIMTHGDDAGLRLPPKIAPVQVIIVIVKPDPDVSAAAENLERELGATGLRVRVDDRTDLGLGRRLTDWELKGVPVRVEIGPRELTQGTVSIARRDGSERESVKLGDAAMAARDGVQLVHEALFAQAAGALESGTTDVDDLDAAIDAARSGFARLPWAACGAQGERRLNSEGLSVRCLTTADGSVPVTADVGDLYAIVARAY
jgi:prolyl-tRNA synthetase